MFTDTDARARQTQGAVRWAILLAAVGVIVYLALAILRPFFGVIAWSSVIAIAFYPVYQDLLARTGRPSLSALLCSLLAVVTILIPVTFITILAVNQFGALREYLSKRFEGGFEVDVIEPIQTAWEWLMYTAGLDPDQALETLARQASNLGGILAEASFAFATNITGAIISFIFTIFATYFLFRDGSAIVARIPDFLPFERAQSERVLRRTRDVIYASVYGVLVIAVIQATMIGLSFWALGVPTAALWGVVTLFTSMIPMLGAWIVWVPGALYLLLTGSWIKAIVLSVWGGVVISSIDNFLRPRLVAGKVGLNELAIFFGVLGGLRVFGLLGIVLGPLVFAIAAAVLAVLTEREPPAAEAAGAVPPEV